ncbi:hypothetical protein JYU20_01430 [Bacteroidales bacterium AH-315-I05]|nr:hypothetical protein [Bacteroidales bacterium AH-315-I05]
MTAPAHFVAIFGGAVSGAEAANQLSQRGIHTVVFEQNALPYGKIEDGLPKWHVKLRDKEENIINEKMNLPLVTYVPNTKLGRDIDFEDVAKNWGFSAVLLATGAWRDRPLPVDGIDEYLGRGLIYQNPFIYWFNHYHEPNYSGEQYEILDDTIVVGGGLASIDVVKVMMMESVARALKEKKGIEINVLDLDRGIDRVLEQHNLTLDDLGIKGCTLYYRRRPIDMPLSPIATDTPELLAKAQMVRQKVLGNAMRKYLFRFQECHAPVDKIVEDGCVTGLVFQKTEIIDGKVIPIEGSETEVRGSQVISSIGSIPELLDGIPTEWETYKLTDKELCRIDGYENVFALGNAVTGKGNIKDSFKHGNELSQKVMDDYLGWTDADFENYQREKENATAETVNAIAESVNKTTLLSGEKIDELYSNISKIQQRAGYDGNYNQWVEKHMPQRLEDLLGIEH